MLSVNFDPFPTLTTERLVLRRTTIDDINEIFFLRSDPGVLKYVKKKPCASLDEAAAFIEKLEASITNNDGLPWAMCLKDNPTLIGCVSIWRLIKEHYRGEIGYMLHPAHQCKGYMNEAVAAVTEYGFRSMGLHSIEANTDPENKASHRVLERTGFMKEGHQRENFYFEGNFYDTITFGLLNPYK